MAYETIIHETLEQGIAVLTLNRPKNYNAVNKQMMEELYDFWNERQYDVETHVVILQGSGDKGFCAGLDMKETEKSAATMSAVEFYNFQERLGLSLRLGPTSRSPRGTGPAARGERPG